MKSIKFRDLLANEIDLRVGATTETGFSLLLYKDARVDMNILDETVGQFNWVKEFYQVKNTLMCKVGINVNYDNDTKEPLFIYKSDAGDESNTEAVKGEASDSFKRACFNWNIGRKLYTSPFVWVKKDQDNDPKKSHYSVKEIAYNEKEIIKLVITNDKTGQVVFSYGAKSNASYNAPKTENKPAGDSQYEQDMKVINDYIKVVGADRFNVWLERAYGRNDVNVLTHEELHRAAQVITKTLKEREGN